MSEVRVRYTFDHLVAIRDTDTVELPAVIALRPGETAEDFVVLHRGEQLVIVPCLVEVEG